MSVTDFTEDDIIALANKLVEVEAFKSLNDTISGLDIEVYDLGRKIENLTIILEQINDRLK